MGVLVSPSASPCNDSVADARLEWKCLLGKMRISRNLRKNQIRIAQIKAVGYQIGGINCGKRHYYCREFQSINDFILRNWGACVDTIFGHVSIIDKV